MRAISAIGFSVPSTLETWATATSFGPRSSSFAKASMSSRPSPVIGAQSISAPAASASCCHGTTFEWCSISVSRMRSPAPTLATPQVRATRLIASVALRTKITSRRLAAPRWSATVARAPS